MKTNINKIRENYLASLDKTFSEEDEYAFLGFGLPEVGSDRNKVKSHKETWAEERGFINKLKDKAKKAVLGKNYNVEKPKFKSEGATSKKIEEVVRAKKEEASKKRAFNKAQKAANSSAESKPVVSTPVAKTPKKAIKTSKQVEKVVRENKEIPAPNVTIKTPSKKRGRAPKVMSTPSPQVEAPVSNKTEDTQVAASKKKFTLSKNTKVAGVTALSAGAGAGLGNLASRKWKKELASLKVKPNPTPEDLARMKSLKRKIMAATAGGALIGGGAGYVASKKYIK